VALFSFTLTDNPYRRLGKMLEKEKILPRNDFKEIFEQSKKENRPFLAVLWEKEGLPEDKLNQALARYFRLPEVRLREKTIDPEVLNLIPKEIAEHGSIVIFKKIKNIIYVATTNPENKLVFNFIKKKTGLDPKIFITSPADLKQAIKKYKTEIASEFEKIIDDSIKQVLSLHENTEKLAQVVPTIKMVDTIIEQALLQNASDIHIEPVAEKISVRYRIDGLLQKIVTLPKQILPTVVTRIKILANLKIDEHRLPQDGRFKFEFNERPVAIRVSVMPTLNGAKVVLRLLDVKEKQFSLRRLGLNVKDFVTVKKEMIKPHGLILVTGPTGSGKTTTLYAILRMLNKEGVNICTIEDPIEYGLEGINQTQINPSAGLTFASGLRSLVRQDPDIIMVGEIRDLETADMAINAAMTGHLVLSTLHTNSAFLVIQRLIEMGIKPFLAASVINVVMGQRLVRKICRFCKSQRGSAEKILAQYGGYFDLENALAKFKRLKLLPPVGYNSLSEIKFAHGKGCPKCHGTGYLGRIGIYEILKNSSHIYQTILKDPTANAIKNEALKHDILTMTEDGLLKVLKGQTTFEEVLRVTKE